MKKTLVAFLVLGALVLGPVGLLTAKPAAAQTDAQAVLANLNSEQLTQLIKLLISLLLQIQMQGGQTGGGLVNPMPNPPTRVEGPTTPGCGCVTNFETGVTTCSTTCSGQEPQPDQRVRLVPESLPAITVGELPNPRPYYSEVITATGFTAGRPLTWSVVRGAMPAGFTLNKQHLACAAIYPSPCSADSTETYQAFIYGSTANLIPGSYTFVVQATNGSQTVQREYTIVVKKSETDTKRIHPADSNADLRISMNEAVGIAARLGQYHQDVISASDIWQTGESYGWNTHIVGWGNWSPFHPADTNRDFSINLSENTAYAAAHGENDPNVISATYLWKNGEAYARNFSTRQWISTPGLGCIEVETGVTVCT